MSRGVFIGDVHGCSHELGKLLEQLAITQDDQVYFVGDLVARGPDSTGVLRMFREIGAKACIGNHEQRLLSAHHARKRGETGPRLGASHQRVLSELSDADWEVIERLPLHIDVPEHAMRVVHAGVLPSVPFEQQDPWVLTHIRSVDGGGKPSDRWGTPWGVSYEGPPHIVFGHNARKHPQLHPHATGLDTGCVYGGALTALVLPNNEFPPPPADRQDAMLSVRSERAYSDYGRELPD